MTHRYFSGVVEMKRETYWHQGSERTVIRVNWIGLARKYFVRRTGSTGYVTGHLTDRNGFGNCTIAKGFDTAQDAALAASKTGARFFQVLHNTEGF